MRVCINPMWKKAILYLIMGKVGALYNYEDQCEIQRQEASVVNFGPVVFVEAMGAKPGLSGQKILVALFS